MFADLKDCRWVLEPYRELEPPDVLKQSIGMREGQDASRAIFWVGDGLKAKIGELARDFSGTFRGFGFDHESVRAPAHNGDVASTAEFAGGIEPRGFLEREKSHIEEV